MQLLPGSFDDDIQVELLQIYFKNDHSKVPKYEALSYVWGDPAPTQPRIRASQVLDNSHKEQYLTVRENLWSALKHLRHADEKRLLWIDAICIDQENATEKSHQVAHMGFIFKQAFRVVIWFGPAAPETRGCMSMFRRLSSVATYDVQKDILAFSHPDGSTQPHPAPHVVFTRNDLKALIQTLSCTWFERVWTLQEVGLTDPGKAIIQWGPESLPFHSFQTVMMAYQGYFINQDKWPTFLKEKWATRRALAMIFNMAWFYEGISFTELMNVIRYRECHDPRDRIYAALNISRTDLGVVPDYKPKHTAAALYTQVCIEQLEQGNDMLSACQWPSGMEGLPSWVPNWHSKRMEQTIFVGGNMGLLSNEYRRGNGADLFCWGCQFAEITDFIDLGLTAQSTDEYVCLAIEKLVRWIWPQGIMPGALLMATSRVVLAEAISDFCWPPGGDLPYPTLRDAMQTLYRAQLGKLSGGISPLIARNIRERSSGRVFVKTSSNELGLTLNTTRVGDHLYAVPGCRLPLVLRPVSSTASAERMDQGKHDTKYRVIGTAFIDGQNMGESLLGTLGRVREIWMFLEGGFGYGEAGATEQPLRLDPRIAKLYLELRGEEASEEMDLSEVYARITPDVLRENGARLKQITLV